MAGLRIHHTTLKDCTLVVRHPGGPRPGGGQRRPKDYHIHLDSNGDTIVSETVWLRLQEANKGQTKKHEFVVLNEVPDPPDIVVGDTSAGIRRTFRQDETGEIRDAEIQSVAQSFAPRGVKARITPS